MRFGHVVYGVLATTRFIAPRRVEGSRLAQISGIGIPVAPTNTSKRSYYYETISRDRDIGIENPHACAGNPLKGLVVADPDDPNFDPQATTVDAALDYYSVGLNEVLVADPNVVGVKASFNWTALEQRLESSHAERHRHVVLSFHVHYPGRPLSVPQYLMDQGITLHKYDGFLDGGQSPDYGDPLLLRALQLFVEQFGAKYDGDARIGFVHMGLLGYWGEWMTFPDDWIPDESKRRLTEWYQAAFSLTHVSTRYPYEPAYRAGFGYHDGSFAYHTLDTNANEAVHREEYFWPSVEAAGHADFWKSAPMGGETRKELQPIVFDHSLPAATDLHQDFMQCVETTHASYIFHQDAFVQGGYHGEKLDRATEAHVSMGYNFLVDHVGLAESSLGEPGSALDFDVTVMQVGVAPFYYPLSLVLSCKGTTRVMHGVETTIEAGDTKVFTFEEIPAAGECLEKLSLTLSSPYAIHGRPIKFAQGYDGEVSLSLPLPPSSTTDQSGILFGLSLVRIFDDDKWSIVQALHKGDLVDLSKVGKHLSVRADTVGTVASVSFFVDGFLWDNQTTPPFALGGSRGDAFNIVTMLGEPGTKAITAIAYNADDIVVGHLIVPFTVLESVDDPDTMYNPVRPDLSLVPVAKGSPPSSPIDDVPAAASTVDDPTSAPSASPSTKLEKLVALSVMGVGSPAPSRPSNDSASPTSTSRAPTRFNSARAPSLPVPTAVLPTGTPNIFMSSPVASPSVPPVLFPSSTTAALSLVDPDPDHRFNTSNAVDGLDLVNKTNGQQIRNGSTDSSGASWRTATTVVLGSAAAVLLGLCGALVVRYRRQRTRSRRKGDDTGAGADATATQKVVADVDESSLCYYSSAPPSSLDKHEFDDDTNSWGELCSLATTTDSQQHETAVADTLFAMVDMHQPVRPQY